MSLVFALLQKDYIVVAADSRHTRGDRTGGLYRNDQGIKTTEALRDSAILGFAGHDFGESLVSNAKRTNLLDADGSLQRVAESFSAFARTNYDKQYSVIDNQQFAPGVEFLLAGWSHTAIGPLATAYTHRLPGEVSCVEATYPFRRFEIIGKSCHGALYALHRFGNQDISLNAALRLSTWVMREVCEQDTSTGGNLQLYVLSPNSQILKKQPEEISELVRIAETAGKELGDLLLRRD
jgi:hypothetical protein